MGFFLYKGLKKPLVFFGLKDKYIYYAGSLIIGGFILVAILNSFIGFSGTLIGFGIIGGGLWGIIYLQDKKGLYKKTRNHNQLHIFPKKIKNTNLLRLKK